MIQGSDVSKTNEQHHLLEVVCTQSSTCTLTWLAVIVLGKGKRNEI
jgi:hypothetical protein